MSANALRFDQAPPFSVPLRFFLFAPLFGLAAAILIAVEGAGVLGSRWVPVTIATVHLLTLGFVTQVMIGALMQLMPVVAGTPVARPRALAWAVQLPLLAGVVLFAAGLVRGTSAVLGAGLVGLGGALGGFALAALATLRRAPASSPTIHAMRLALAGLLLTVLLGVAVGVARSAPAAPWFPPSGPHALVDLHLAWGLLGWVTLLVIGVAYQVVPMFQLTPAYPLRLQRLLAPAMFAALLAWSALHALAMPAAAAMALQAGAAYAVLAGAALFALVTLRLQARRRRRHAEATTGFWRLGMASLLAAVGMAATLPWRDDPRAPLLVGALGLVGFASSLIHGMLYKIVPFLAWLHLHQRGIRYVLPNMKEILPDRRTLLHLRVHVAATIVLCGAILAPQLPFAPVVAGLLLALSYGWLELNLLYAVRLYRRALRAPSAAPHGD